MLRSKARNLYISNTSKIEFNAFYIDIDYNENS